MNVPNNTKAFSLEMAQQGHPLVTLGGVPVKFVAYVPDAKEGFNLVVMIDGIVHAFPKDGKPTHPAFHLLLAPLGFCEGLPVFAGDVLTGGDSNPVYKGKDFVVEPHHDTFIMFKWPSKAPVVETRMTDKELTQASGYCLASIKAGKNLANKAISRAIADGDVIPTKDVYKLIDEVKYKADNSFGSYYDAIETVMHDYLEGLK